MIIRAPVGGSILPASTAYSCRNRKPINNSLMEMSNTGGICTSRLSLAKSLSVQTAANYHQINCCKIQQV